MAKENKIIINPSDKIQELIIREGSALPLVNPTKIAIDGILDAPGQILTAKKHLFEKDKCHIIVNADAGSIIFVINETDPFGHKISGKLTKADALNEFHINSTEKKFSLHELVKLIKKTKFYFPDKEEHANILISLQNFSASIKTDIQKSNDNRGNSKNLLERMSQSQAPAGFKLQIPIYEGYDPVIFYIEVGLDPTDSDVRFYLESQELFELLETEKRRLLKGQLGLFTEWGCAIVNV